MSTMYYSCLQSISDVHNVLVVFTMC